MPDTTINAGVAGRRHNDLFGTEYEQQVQSELLCLIVKANARGRVAVAEDAQSLAMLGFDFASA
eukprot:2464280-Rhodomonas_salina.1